jgi:F420-dependent oxidoreductase-like protein
MPVEMKLRVLLEAHHGATYDQTLALALATEEAGFDAFFRSDHYLGIEADNPRFEPTDSWTTLAGLARDTRRVRLGTLVTAGTFRLPGVLAITTATVDAMSGGRVELGLGAAWYPQEHARFGMPFPAIGERFDRLEEQLQIITGLWTTPMGEPFSFAGTHYQLEDCRNFPRPVQSPRPPIIVGGGGPRRTPTLAARFADEFNGGFGDGLAERFARFRRICEETGRDPATVTLSAVLPVFCGRDADEAARRAATLGGHRLREAAACGGPDAVVERLQELADWGAQTVYFHIFDVEDVDHVRLLGSEVLPRVAGV